ncbi:MAG TPA: hypothetical protein VMY37_13460 [Thermoguttaceae bacterium]|nr:hypothetical protein [Thermoguttaceae bacterium]
MEKREVVDQKADRALALIASRARLFARQGAVVATWRSYRGRRLGPYWRLAYREAGRQCSVYLGRAGRGVERVRQALAELQGRLRWRRTYRRLCRQVKASLRACQAEFDRQLRRLGLRRKGFEVRGGWSRGLARHFSMSTSGPAATNRDFFSAGPSGSPRLRPCSEVPP